MTAVQVLFADRVRVPPRPKTVVRRTRLVELLHEAIGWRLILLSAPAGFGKSSLLADFAGDASCPVCWYSIDPLDRDLSTFVQHVIASVRQQFPNFDTSMLEAVGTSTNAEASPKRIAAQFALDVQQQISEFFVMILDDFQAVDGHEEIHRFIDALLEQLNDQATIIIASRTLPQQLRLSRLAAAGQAIGIGHQELAFTPDEISQFFASNVGIVLSDQEAKLIHEFSRGWIAAIALSKNMWPKRLLEHAAAFGSSPSDLFEYVSQEVVSQLESDAVDFLKCSSVFPRAVPSWCDELLGRSDSRRLLEQLSNQILFITKREGPPLYYEYHALFREYLLSRLRLESQTSFADLHGRAAALAAREGFPELAVELSITGEGIEDALKYIQDCGEQLQREGKWNILKDWFANPVIEPALERRPSLLLQKARVEERTGETDQALLDCTKARSIFRRLGDRDGEARSLVAHARTLIRKGQFRVAEDVVHEALEILPPQDLLLEAQAREVIGLCLRHAGDLEGARRNLETALARAQEADDLRLQGSVERNLASVLLTSDELTEAYQHYRAARAIWARLSDVALESAALNGLGIVQWKWGNYEESDRLYREALDKVHAAGTYPQFEGVVLANLAENALDTRDYGRSERHCLDALEIARRVDNKWLIGWSLYILAESRRLQARILESETAARECINWATQSGTRQNHARVLLNMGAIAASRRDARQADSCFRQALELFQTLGTPRDLAKARIRYGLFSIDQGNIESGTEMLHTACATLERIGQPTAACVEISQHPSRLLEKLEGSTGLSIAVRRALDRARQWNTVYLWPPPFRGAALAKPSSLEKGTRIAVKAFGVPCVEFAGKRIDPVEWGAVTARDMFYFFLLHPLGLRKEQVTAELWPDLTPARGNSQFHSNLYRLRRALGTETVVLHDGRYVLGEAAAIQSDFQAFESQVQKAVNGVVGSDADAEQLADALELYKGPFLEDCYAEWCLEYRARLQNLYIQGNLALASYFESKEIFQRSLGLLQKALAVDYSLDGVHLSVMRLWIRLEEPALAAQHYKEYADWCKQEMGGLPPSELAAAYNQALRLMQRS